MSNHCLYFIAAFIDYAAVLSLSLIILKTKSTYEQLQSFQIKQEDSELLLFYWLSTPTNQKRKKGNRKAAAYFTKCCAVK